METLGISTSKVAKLQHESAGEVAENELNTVRISLGIICGAALSLTCLLSTILYPVVRLWLRRRREGEGEGEEPPGGGGGGGEAFTVYDKVDLLLPAQCYSDCSLETTATTASTVRSHHSLGRQEERQRESIL